MTPEQHARVEEAFHAALTQPPSLRERYLLDTEPDPDVRAAVRRLLEHAAHDDSSDPLAERLAQAFAAPDAATARQVGAYRLLRELGAGGMGTVFLAERDAGDGVQRVALKLLHGLPTQAANRRMARERGLLASLDHPQIARHIDGGVSESGQPYLVMDYVEGASLHEYLAATPGTTRQRLRLFLRLCDAVQHAHQRLVLHRDLKPSNIVVRADGAPVLLDFGIATLMAGDEERPALTATVAFTPAYSAPEQRRGERATTATDVFGLGALLFDLLSERKLADVRGRDAPVPAPGKHAHDPALRRALRGDLDRIVLAACAEAPDERYPTVAALATDVQRYLDGLPISVAVGGPVYRLRKFVARHRLATAAAVVALAAAGLFVWRLDSERQRALAAEYAAQLSRLRAEREAGYTEASRNFLASVLAQTAPQSIRGEPITVATLLARASEQLQAEQGQDPRTRAIAWLTIAEVYDAILDPQAALDAADKARTLMAGAGLRDPEFDARVLRVHGASLAGLDRFDESMRELKRLIVMRERRPEDAVAIAQAYYQYIAVAVRAASGATTERYVRHALGVLDRAGETAPELRAHLRIALVTPAMDAGDLPLAQRRLDEAVSAARSGWRENHPDGYIVHLLTAQLRRLQSRHDEAIAEGEQAVRLAYKAYGERSRLTMEMENDLAASLSEAGRRDEALAHYQRAYSIAQQLGLQALTMAQLQINLGTFHLFSGDAAQALEMETAALALLAARADTNETAQLTWRQRAHASRAKALMALERKDEAYLDFEAAIGLARQLGDIDGMIGSQLQLAKLRMKDEQFDQAQQLLDTAKRAVDGGKPEQRNFEPGIDALSAQLARKRGDLALASRRMSEALTSAAKAPGYNAVMIAKLKLVAASIEIERGESAAARRLLDEVIPVVRDKLPADAPERVKADELMRKLTG
ncbi:MULTISPECIES: serine/threonine-protein kinase [unclassified Lysobacter]|uniref:serine/threonine-protein kinase n=1 Tax=unclassified Lysobacter TaxID=2635362 RepID=UPI001BE653F3|nr:MULTISPECIES: serine/threonine-protein kinase [unclassified Lysobacter]MBT2750226.1 protein kinase [Lysobacter sp. ISL-50]MBT2775203.1 protein kinase [Lysobacter sp. ISL-54]MBT2782576.1 protein kinase [Lysobacter sp. ISL-52]